MEGFSQILEEELIDAVEVKNPKSLHRYIMILTQNIVSMNMYQSEQQDRKSEIKELIAFSRESFNKIDQRFKDLQIQLDKRFESIQIQMDKRFEKNDERFTNMQTQMDKRFEDIQTQMDRRFNAVDKKFTMMFSFMTLGFTLLAVLFTVFNYI